MVDTVLEKMKVVVFDLDGTIVDSKLDFSMMRNDLGLSETQGILEEIDKFECEIKRTELLDIVRKHELNGAKEAVLMSGFKNLYEYLTSSGIPIGILTRNSLEVTEMTLKKFKLSFDILLTRDNCEPKPSPMGLHKVMAKWNTKPHEIIYIGDSEYDLQTAKNADVASILFKSSYNEGYFGDSDHTINCFKQLIPKK